MSLCEQDQITNAHYDIALKAALDGIQRHCRSKLHYEVKYSTESL